jgi:acetyltransferase-like isoleucine patch superfamily enzyme
LSVNRLHAFADGTTLPGPERLTYLPPDHPHQALAESVWSTFRSAAVISPLALLGVNAWPVNLRGEREWISIGDHTVVRGLIRVERRGYVSIADHCYVGDDAILSAHVGIVIESDVLIAHGCQIFDNVSHPIAPDERAKHYRAILAGEPYDGPIPAVPVIIEQNAWIGMNSIIMRGVRIGARSIVAAGSVVVRDVPPDTMVGGNPAHSVGLEQG